MYARGLRSTYYPDSRTHRNRMSWGNSSRQTIRRSLGHLGTQFSSQIIQRPVWDPRYQKRLSSAESFLTFSSYVNTSFFCSDLVTLDRRYVSRLWRAQYCFEHRAWLSLSSGSVDMMTGELETTHCFLRGGQICSQQHVLLQPV